MSAASQTPGERAWRYAVGAKAVLHAFADKEQNDLAWGLHMLSSEAADVLINALDSGDMDELEEASLRYCKVNAILYAMDLGAGKDLLLAGEALMQATKEMIDAEWNRLSSLKS